MKWKCKDGKEIEIQDMETSHIQNAISMLKKRGFIGYKTLMAYVNAPYDSMGDGAQMAFDMEFNAIIDMPVSASLDYLEEELNKRQNAKEK